MADHSNMKLGKLRAKRDPRVRMLSVVTSNLPPAPEAVSWSKDLPSNFGMMANDRLGDCTCAAIGHAIQVMTANARPPMVTISDDAVIDLYHQFCGYNSNDPNSDQGGIEVDVLNCWMRQPVLGEHTLDAFGAISPANRQSVRDAIWLFGGVYIGIEMPAIWQTMEIWDTPPTWQPGLAAPVGPAAPGSWGGHAVFGCAYNTRGVYVITWGKLQFITWSAWDTYVSEAYPLLLGKDWFNEQRRAPPGFSYDDTVTYLNALRG